MSSGNPDDPETPAAEAVSNSENPSTEGTQPGDSEHPPAKPARPPSKTPKVAPDSGPVSDAEKTTKKPVGGRKPGDGKKPGDASPAHQQGSVPMPLNYVIRFVDMKERNDEEFDRLLRLLNDLNAQMNQPGGQITPEQQDELTQIGIGLRIPQNALGDINETIGALHVRKREQWVFDPFFLNIRHSLGRMNGSIVGYHRDGVLPAHHAGNNLDAHEKALAAVFGLMELDGLTDPSLPRFTSGVATALGEYTASKGLFDKVLDIVAGEGDTRDSSNIEGINYSEVRAEQWVSVVRSLRAERVRDTDAQLPLKARTILASAAENAAPSTIDIDLPDLDATINQALVKDNIVAMQPIYYAARLEEMQMFQVVDKLIEQFLSGMLPLGKGPAGDRLYKYWKDGVTRMSEVDRRNLYARSFGFATGDPQVMPNREFNDLWLRFVSAVSSFLRQFTLEDMLRSNIPVPVTQQQVQKSGIDLAANLSLHGYGIAYFAATEFQAQIKEIISLLSDPEIMAAYGARDMWQVIEQVSALELGGAKNTIRYRTMAMAGSVIIRWLANRAQALAGGSLTSVIDLNQVRNPNNRSRNPMVNPTDRDLADACDQWLAVTGTQEESVEQYAQPVEAPNQTSRPVQIPQIAKDMLESVGVTAGLSTKSYNGRG